MNSRHPTVFRVAAVLEEPVDPVVLQKAVDQTIGRFPAFRVRLRAGLFWHYLEEHPVPLFIEEEDVFPCRRFRKRENQRFRLRVLHFRNRISVEFFHSLTDASGAMVFLKTLTAQYLRLKDVSVPFTESILDVAEAPLDEEMEDAYSRHASFRVIRRPSETPAWHLHGTDLPEGYASVITGLVPADRMLQAARARGVTLTEWIAALLLDHLQIIQETSGRQTRRPLRVSVPVNMRRFFPSATVRNFSLFANPGIEPAFGSYSFDETVDAVHHFMRLTMTAKNLNALMCANVRPEKSTLLRLTPLPLKSLAMRVAYHQSGESRYTTVLSNIGRQVLPEGMSEHVHHLEFMLGPSRDNPVVCAVVTCGECLAITFTGTIRETTLQRRFFRSLVERDIPVELISNHIPDRL